MLYRKEREFMENFNDQRKKSKNIGKKIFKYVLLLVVLLMTYAGVFYLGNTLLKVLYWFCTEKAVSDLRTFKILKNIQII